MPTDAAEQWLSDNDPTYKKRTWKTEDELVEDSLTEAMLFDPLRHQRIRDRDGRVVPGCFRARSLPTLDGRQSD